MNYNLTFILLQVVDLQTLKLGVFAMSRFIHFEIIFKSNIKGIYFLNKLHQNVLLLKLKLPLY